MLTRKIVHIDEEKCDGCGQCVPNCHEGAIRIINGKARLVAENLCDGLGACLGTCPLDAITVEERPAEEFDEQAVARHLKAEPHAPAAPAHPAAPPISLKPAALAPAAAHAHGGCPGSRMRMWNAPAEPAPSTPSASQQPSRLRQWPVQLALVPPSGPLWQDADVLIAADCIPFACADFHDRMLTGKTLAIACPKLDNVQPYLDKLTRIFAGNTIRSVTVARMEVPCCGGLVRAVEMALAQAGRTDIPLKTIVVKIDGSVA